MVEECQVDGAVDIGGCVLDLPVCRVWVRVAGLGDVHWEVGGDEHSV